MVAFGKVLYVCEDCHEETWFYPPKLICATRPRCSFCGSTWIVPQSKCTRKKIAELHEEKTKRKGIRKGRMNYVR